MFFLAAASMVLTIGQASRARADDGFHGLGIDGLTRLQCVFDRTARLNTEKPGCPTAAQRLDADDLSDRFCRNPADFCAEVRKIHAGVRVTDTFTSPRCEPGVQPARQPGQETVPDYAAMLATRWGCAEPAPTVKDGGDMVVSRTCNRARMRAGGANPALIGKLCAVKGPSCVEEVPVTGVGKLPATKPGESMEAYVRRLDVMGRQTFFAQASIGKDWSDQQLTALSLDMKSTGASADFRTVSQAAYGDGRYAAARRLFEQAKASVKAVLLARGIDRGLIDRALAATKLADPATQLSEIENACTAHKARPGKPDVAVDERGAANSPLNGNQIGGTVFVCPLELMDSLSGNPNKLLVTLLHEVAHSFDPCRLGQLTAPSWNFDSHSCVTPAGTPSGVADLLTKERSLMDCMASRAPGDLGLPLATQGVDGYLGFPATGPQGIANFDKYPEWNQCLRQRYADLRSCSPMEAFGGMNGMAALEDARDEACKQHPAPSATEADCRAEADKRETAMFQGPPKFGETFADHVASLAYPGALRSSEPECANFAQQQKREEFLTAVNPFCLFRYNHPTTDVHAAPDFRVQTFAASAPIRAELGCPALTPATQAQVPTAGCELGRAVP